MIREFQFGPWLPDETDLNNPGLELCRNAIPSPGGYKPFPGMALSGADLGARALSAAMFERGDGTRVTVAATAGDLHTVINGVVDDSGLTLALTAPVSFSRFGDTIYATSKAGTWYLDDIETDTTFVAAGWDVPFGKCIGRIGEFLFMGDLIDVDASDAPYRVRWSPFNNPQGDWETSIALQSDAVEMPHDFGIVMGIAGYSGGGTSGLIFQRNGISRISYTGGASVFSKTVVDAQRGCAAPYSIAQVGDNVYFLSDDGFFVTNGTAAESISRARVWEWFVGASNQVYNGRVSASVDWPNRCVLWTLMGDDGNPNGVLVFNWETGQWSQSDVVVDCLLASGRDGMTLEDVSAEYPNLDLMDTSLDSDAFLPRGKSVGGFVGGVFGQLAGDPLAARFGTGEFQPEPGKRVFVRGVTPLLMEDSGGTRVHLIGRNRQNSIAVSAGDVALGPLGFAPFNFDVRYARVDISTAAGTVWSNGYGFQVDYSVSGAG